MVMPAVAVMPSAPVNTVELQPLQDIDPTGQLGNTAITRPASQPRDSIAIEPEGEDSPAAQTQDALNGFEGTPAQGGAGSAVQGVSAVQDASVLHTPEPPQTVPPTLTQTQPTKVTPALKIQKLAGVVPTQLNKSLGSPKSEKSLNEANSDEQSLWFALGAMLLLGMAAPVFMGCVVALQCCGTIKIVARVEPYLRQL